MLASLADLKLMELFFLALILFVTLYYLSYIFKHLYSTKNHAAKEIQLPRPPGSTGWPLLGETLEFLSTGRKGALEKFVADRSNNFSSKIFKTSLLGEKMAILCDAEGNKFLFSNENKLVRSWWPSTIQKVFANSNKTNTEEESMRMRRVLSPFLKPDALQKYIGIMDSVTKQHLNTYWDKQLTEVKVYLLAKKYTFALGCGLFLDIKDPEIIARLEKPFNRISAGFISLPVNLPWTKYGRAIRASKEIRNEIEVMIRKRKKDLLEKRVPPTEDVLSHLLLETYEDGEYMNESDIANKLFGLLVGAYDNISMTLVSIIKYLAELPEVYQEVLREQREIAKSKGSTEELLNWGDIKKMRYSWNVACEVLRLLPPTPGTFREVLTDFTYHGFLVPKGWKIHWNAYATHKNPEYFPEPEKFDPSRFEGNGPTPFSYVPFGGGPRMCPGKEYARLKVLVFMHNVVNRFKWEKIFPDEKIIVDPVLMPTKGLPIRLYPHNP